jgi:GT2 family glycosyltransferase
VDILNANGYDAAIVAPVEGFRCSWFKNETKIVGPDEEVGPGDFLVLSEVLPCVPDIKGADDAHIIIFAQNPFSLLRGYGGVTNHQEFYREKVKGVMCVSDHSLQQISRLFPDTEIHRIRYSFDKPPFGPSDVPKENRIIYMARRRAQEIEAALMIASSTGVLKGWRIESIVDKTEDEVAELMKRSLVFISGSLSEGFGMPPAEAMASGCVVIGWHGHGGREFLLPGVSYPIPEGDILDCANTIKEVLALPRPQLLDIGQMASEYIRSSYSSGTEVQSILSAWKHFTGKNIFPMPKVAAFVSTYDEGPYLEAALKWLSPRVGRVYVIESKTSFHGAHVPEGERQTPRIVGELVKSGLDNIVYRELEGKEHPAPDIKEAHERNQALEMIERDGFEWVWVVDADEFYMDQEAENMWAWFLDLAERSPDVQGAKCTWYTYWRSLRWRIDPPEQFHPNIIVRPSCRIASSRHLLPEQQNRIVEVPRDICMARHYSWAHTPEYVQRKLATWTHAHQVQPGWYDRVFMGWTPGSEVQNLHPVQSEAYGCVVKDDGPLPEALTEHPYALSEVIGAKKQATRIKAVILNHNMPQAVDALFEALDPVFDDVEIFDAHSDPDKIPVHVGRSLKENYWTGGWNEILGTCADYDAVWMLGDDLTLGASAQEYRDAIESSLPFGCWSPCVEGRAKPFMQAEYYQHGEPRRVKNMEGMALAMSKEMMQFIGRLPEGSDGYGQDLWMCHKAREMGLPNIIDGRVCVYHPEGIRYDDTAFHQQMETVFGGMFGPDFRQTAFLYDDRYDQNLMEDNTMKDDAQQKGPAPQQEKGKKFTIVTVDNGWGFPDFVRVTNHFPDARKIVMTKGFAEIPPHQGIEVLDYDASMSLFLSEADVALMPKVGVTTKDDLLKLMKAGIPCVVHQDFSQGVVEHMKNGFIYQVLQWAQQWIDQIKRNPGLRKTVEAYDWGTGATPEPAPAPAPPPAAPPVPAPAPSLIELPDNIRVTVITPTWNRPPEIIKRCIDSIRLQTTGDWVQLVCSNGPSEPPVEALVRGMNDQRIRYADLGKPQGENNFGNAARKMMLTIAEGDYVAFVDDDNIVLPDFLETMVSVLDNSPDCDFAVCDIMHFGPLNEQEVGKPPIVLKGEPVKLYHIDPLQVVVRTKAIQEVGWDTEVGYLSDGVTLENLGKGRKYVKVDSLFGVHL